MKSKLDKAAEQLLEIFEKHLKDLPAAERDAKWRAFDAVVAKVGTDKSRSPRVARRQA